MTDRTLREWDYLSIGDGRDELPRPLADALVDAAARSPLGGSEGEKILINGHKRLRARQTVGVLTARGVTLEILPKIEAIEAIDDRTLRGCLIHMLARVYDLDIAPGELAKLGEQSRDLLEILIRLFCDRLHELVRRGLPRRYVGCEDDLPTLRGRLDVVRQFTVLAATPQKLACRYEELSPDILLNRIMKTAVTRLTRVARAESNRRKLRELGLAFADVEALPPGAVPWDRLHLDRTNRTWRVALNFAKLLLGNRFQTTSSGGTEGISLMFEMNTLFEEFIGREMRAALEKHGYEVRLQGPRRHALERRDADGHFITKPDIVVARDGEIELVVDTKWKRISPTQPHFGVSSSDAYQMLAYARVYTCNRILLLYPHNTELPKTAGLLAHYAEPGESGVKVAIARISLADIRNTRDDLLALFDQAVRI